MRLYEEPVTGTLLNTGSVQKNSMHFPCTPEGHRKKTGLALTRVTGREPRTPEGEWNCVNPCGKW